MGELVAGVEPLVGVLHLTRGDRVYMSISSDDSSMVPECRLWWPDANQGNYRDFVRAADGMSCWLELSPVDVDQVIADLSNGQGYPVVEIGTSRTIQFTKVHIHNPKEV